jgi:hypothetical protein
MSQTATIKPAAHTLLAPVAPSVTDTFAVTEYKAAAAASSQTLREVSGDS